MLIGVFEKGLARVLDRSDGRGDRAPKASESRIQSSDGTRALLLGALAVCIVVAATRPFVFSDCSPEADLSYMAYSIRRGLQSGELPEHMAYGRDLSPLFCTFYGYALSVMPPEDGQVLSSLNSMD